jgi:hypothetical protein
MACAYRKRRRPAGFGGKSVRRPWGVSPADAGSLIGFLIDGKWEYGRRFFLPCPYRKCYCGRLAHTRATSVLANCQRRKFGAPSKRYLNTIVTRSIGLALHGPFCVDPVGRRGSRDPQRSEQNWMPSLINPSHEAQRALPLVAMDTPVPAIARTFIGSSSKASRSSSFGVAIPLSARNIGRQNARRPLPEAAIGRIPVRPGAIQS